MVNAGVGGEDEDDQYYDDDDRPQRAQQVPQYDENALAKWLQSIYPKLSQLLETNFNSRIFDNYEVFWDEERGDIEMWQKL